MTVKTTPYLSFRDNARSAMEAYQGIFGGELEIIPMSDVMPGGSEDLVGHSFLSSDHLEVMASDTPPGMDFAPPAGFSLSINGDDEPTMRRYWDALSEGGQVTMPLEKAPWGDYFGMLVDRFGTSWGVNITGASE